MAKTIWYVSPEAPPEPSQAEQGAQQPVKTLAGGSLRMGTLDNRKPNADHLLAMLMEGLGKQVSLQSVFAASKPTASSPAKPEVLDTLAKEADLVITAMAD